MRRPTGFSVVELMIAVALGVLVTLSLLAVFLNISRTNNEMAKTNMQVENGRFALQILESDIQHAGFWGGFVPTFDSLVFDGTPNDVPTAVPDPCLPLSNWDAVYRANVLGVPISIHDTPPGTCDTELDTNDEPVIANQQPNTDILVVRYADRCIPGEANCEADLAGRVYFQPSLCAESAQSGTATTIRLAASSATSPEAFEGATIRIVGGSGFGQDRQITSYDGSSTTATVSPGWAAAVDSSSIYTIGADDYVLTDSGFDLRGRSCNTAAPKRKYVSNIYYVRSYAADIGDGVPTLMRASLDFDEEEDELRYRVEPLIEGIEGLRFELGIDGISKTSEPVQLDQALAWQDPTSRTTPRNRGDGIADTACNTASGCGHLDLANAVLAKVFVLTRTVDQTRGASDQRTYCLATLNASGNCPAGYLYTPTVGAQQQYSRHVFSSSVRLHNIAGRRDTP